MTLLADLAIRSSVLLALGLLLSACLSQRSAALRHRVLVASVVAVAALLPLSLALPAWTVPMPAAGDWSVPAVPLRSTITLEQPEAPLGTAETTTPPGNAPVHTVGPLRAPLMIWMAGLIVVAGSLLASLARVRRLAANGARIDDGRWRTMVEQIADRYGLTRKIVLTRTNAPDLLATWGAWRPQVLLPRHADSWTFDRAHVVLCHELAHVRRHDWLVQMCAETMLAVLWFNPLAWMVCARLRRESEQACDDEVLEVGVGGRAYAAHLLDLARQCRRPARAWLSALAMAHPSTLERRITAMLNPRLDRRVPTRRVLAALAVLLLLVTLPLAALRAGQTGPAPLVGTIYDATGAVLPGVSLTLEDATEMKWEATSNASGRFQFPTVGPGAYLLTATLVGFRSLRHEIELREPGDWSPAVTLQVGDLQETVIIRAPRAAAAAPAASGPVRVRVGGSIRAPRKVNHVRPVYPESMREAGLSGVVPIEALIDRDGNVSSVRVVSAQVHPDFAIAAVDAVRQWQFTPTLLNGAAIEVVMTVSVRFDLEG